MSYIASLDQSTTSTKFSVFSTDGGLIAKHLIEHEQICKAEGWLQHNPLEIIKNVKECINGAVEQAKQKGIVLDSNTLLGVGVTNQRETVVCWDQNGVPLFNAIVWCDNRCADVCERFKQNHGEFKQKTGLPVSAYFTLFKILWLIENVEAVRLAVEEKRARFGTIDSWVIFNLTGEYVTDASNASRTYLCNLKGEWDEQLIKISGITKQMLPKIVNSFEKCATIRQGLLSGMTINSILGDQQSSAYAHELKINQAKITYGTGCFLLANIGNTPIIHPSFVTTIMYKQGELIQYGFQCSVECGAGTLNWARRTGFFNQYSELNQLDEESSNEGLHFFPSFGEIYAPFWKRGVQGGLVGLSLATKRKEIVLSIMQSILFRVKDNLKDKVFENVQVIFADGGMTVNHRLMQVQSDLLGKAIVVRERDTCWGVAKGVLTSLTKELHEFKDQKSEIYEVRTQFREKMEAKYAKWCEERKKFYGWQ